jgi:glucose/arabinose dehydrogenase
MRRLCCSLAAALMLSAPTSAVAISQGSIAVTLAPFAVIPAADGTPQDLVSASDGTGRLFVTTRNGKIDILSSSGALQPTSFLNMASAGVSIYTGGEGGLFGLAFSPNFSAPAQTPGSGKFYTFQAEPFSVNSPAADYSHPELRPTTTIDPNNQITIREWTVSGNPNLANTSSRVLLRINHSQSNHQGGSLKFGPDGDLYIGFGDGGGGNDFNGSASSTTDGHTNSIGNGQDTTVPMGKILRIDPNGSNSTNGQYGIPADNPFASGAGGNLKEIYAYGMRNPFRMSFDSANGNLLVGDVGQGQREEVDSIVNGGNYGWPFREGTRDNSVDAGRVTPPGFTSLAPLAEYTHSDGIAIMGGFVYHGSEIPALAGKYVFGDLGGASGATGRLFYMDATGGTISEFKYQGGVTPSSNLYGFGQSDSGELYALFSNGSILAILPSPGDFNRDGHVDAADIVPAMKALTNPVGYEAQYGVPPADLPIIGDVNGDTNFNNADLQYLLTTLKSGGGSNDSVPEPSTFVLVVLAFGLMGFRRRRRCLGR